MNAQLTLKLPTRDIDLSRFAAFTPHTGMHNRWRVLGVGKRGGQVGTLLGTVALKPRGGMTCVIEFDDGKVEALAPMDIAPHLEAA